MISWNAAYDRLKGNDQFSNWFGRGGAAPSSRSFRPISYAQLFAGVAAASSPGQYGAQSGPTNQSFPAGAVILGITATAYQQQTVTTAFQYAPSASPGRRDLFGLLFQYTGDEQITPGSSPVAADALLGSGADTIFPQREIM
ncbi:MAG: hypothetical protein ACSLEZ_15020, partial [Thiobacillus sp.]